MFLFNLSLVEALAWIAGFLIALSVHEAAHAFAANFLGDPTARYAGRVSLNPIRHLDPFGTILLLLVGFGWGKPVPVNPANFANPRTGELLVSLAGPVSNFAVAALLAIPYNFLATPGSDFFMILQTIMFLNVVILAFNLLPIPPLDGGHVVSVFLPPRQRMKFEQFGPILLFGLLAAGIVFQISVLSRVVFFIADIVWALINLSTIFGG